MTSKSYESQKKTSKDSDTFYTAEMTPRKSTSKESEELTYDMSPRLRRISTLEKKQSSQKPSKKKKDNVLDNLPEGETSKTKESEVLTPEMLPTLPQISPSQRKELTKQLSNENNDNILNNVLDNLPEEVLPKAKEIVEKKVQEAPIKKTEKEEMLTRNKNFFKERTWDIHPRKLKVKGLQVFILWSILTALNLYCNETGSKLSDFAIVVKDLLLMMFAVQRIDVVTEWILRTIGLPERVIQIIVKFVHMVYSYIWSVTLRVQTRPPLLKVAGKVIGKVAGEVTNIVANLTGSTNVPKIANYLFREDLITYFIFPYLIPLLNKLTLLLVGGDYKTDLQIQYEAKIKNLQEEGKELQYEKRKLKQEREKETKKLQEKIKNLENKIQRLQDNHIIQIQKLQLQNKKLRDKQDKKSQAQKTNKKYTR